MNGIESADGENAMFKFRQAAAEDFRGMIEESIEESAEIECDDIFENIRVTFDILDKKIAEFFDE